MSVAPRQVVRRPERLQAHRVNWYLLAAGILLLLAIAAVVGILLAIGNHNQQVPTVTVAAQAQASVAAAGAQGATVNSLAAVGSVENATIAVSPGPGWKVAGKSNTFIQLIAPRGIGLLGLESGTLKGGTSPV